MTPADQDDTTPGVIAWRLKSIESALGELVKKLENLPEYVSRIAAVEKDVAAMKDDRKLGFRHNVTTAVAVLALLVAAGGLFLKGS